MYVSMHPATPRINTVQFRGQKAKRTFETDKVLSLATGVGFYHGTQGSMWEIVRFMFDIPKEEWETTRDYQGNLDKIDLAAAALILQYPVLGEAKRRVDALPETIPQAQLKAILKDVIKVLGPTVSVEKF